MGFPKRFLGSKARVLGCRVGCPARDLERTRRWIYEVMCLQDDARDLGTQMKRRILPFLSSLVYPYGAAML